MKEFFAWSSARGQGVGCLVWLFSGIYPLSRRWRPPHRRRRHIRRRHIAVVVGGAKQMKHRHGLGRGVASQPSTPSSARFIASPRELHRLEVAGGVHHRISQEAYTTTASGRFLEHNSNAPPTHEIFVVPQRVLPSAFLMTSPEAEEGLEGEQPEQQKKMPKSLSTSGRLLFAMQGAEEPSRGGQTSRTKKVKSAAHVYNRPRKPTLSTRLSSTFPPPPRSPPPEVGDMADDSALHKGIRLPRHSLAPLPSPLPHSPLLPLLPPPPPPPPPPHDLPPDNETEAPLSLGEGRNEGSARRHTSTSTTYSDAAYPLDESVLRSSTTTWNATMFPPGSDGDAGAGGNVGAGTGSMLPPPPNGAPSPMTSASHAGRELFSQIHVVADTPAEDGQLRESPPAGAATDRDDGKSDTCTSNGDDDNRDASDGAKATLPPEDSGADGEAAGRTRILDITIDVDGRGGEPKEISVYAGDNHQMLAATFVREHGLAATMIPTLTDHISELVKAHAAREAVNVMNPLSNHSGAEARLLHGGSDFGCSDDGSPMPMSSAESTAHRRLVNRDSVNSTELLFQAAQTHIAKIAETLNPHDNTSYELYGAFKAVSRYVYIIYCKVTMCVCVCVVCVCCGICSSSLSLLRTI